MTNIRKLLQESDPLRAESEPSADIRGLRRHAIIAASTASRPEGKSRSPVPIYLGMALAAVILLAAVSHLWSPWISHVQAAVQFEVRLAEQNPGPGLKEARQAGGEKIYLHEEVVVTNRDIAEAKVVPQPDGSQFWVAVTFSPAGAEKMYAATRENIGKRMAIIIDGEVVMAPVVMDPMKESAVINGYITRQEAERVVEGIMIR